MISRAAILALAVLWPSTVWSSAAPADPSWTMPHAPYRIADGLYYVGTQGIGCYLIVTPQGEILLDSGPQGAAPVIEANIRKLGFKLKDVKYLIETHAHYDHVGGMAKLKKDTGATFVASHGDRWALQHGRHDGQTNYGVKYFPAVKVDRAVADGDTLSLGGVTMAAHLTPGHTRGDTTWTMDVRDHGVVRHVVFYGSATVAGNILVGNKVYPGIVADYRLTFQRLKTLKADILLANHPEVAHLEDKYQAQLKGKRDAFVDPAALPVLVAQSEADFNAELQRQESRK